MDIENLQHSWYAWKTNKVRPSLAFIEECLTAIERGDFAKEEYAPYVRYSVILAMVSLSNKDQHGWWDKIPLLVPSSEHQGVLQKKGVRCVPGSYVRRGVYIGQSVVLMPCFVNIGAHIGESSMIDMHAAVGSCARIGRRCHVSMHAGIGGVLEPIENREVCIGDDCFIGAGAQISEGVRLGAGCILGSGTILTASTKVWDRVHKCYKDPHDIPSGAVLVSGSHESSTQGAIIIKYATQELKQRLSINELLRP